MNSSLLILGGTGIIGAATAKKAMEKGFNVTVTGTDKILLRDVEFIHANDLCGVDRKWDVIFDVFTFGREHAKDTYQKFNGKTGQIFVMSSTLVYDRGKLSFERIFSNHKKAKPNSQGGYVNHKIELEEFWSGVKDIDWTILRSYHIIGKGSYLGCIPPHNRNPYLIDQIKSGKISLCDGGRIPLNIVNPGDIGEVVLKSIGKTTGKSYNVVNPVEVIARDYYLKIADILGVRLKINNISGEDIWCKGDWKLTTLPHLYDVSDLKKDIGYVPLIGLEDSLKEAILNLPEKLEKKKTPVYNRMHIPPEPVLHRYFE